MAHRAKEKSQSNESVYTILIQLPPSGENVSLSDKQPSIRMICEENEPAKDDSATEANEAGGTTQQRR